MMRRPAATCLLALGLACAGTADPGGKTTRQLPAATDEALRRDAAVLRAEDRRQVDDALIGALTADAPGVRARAVLALARVGGAFADELSAALGDESSPVRAAAAFSLGLSGDPAAAAALAGRAADPAAEVREAVARALSRTGGPAALDAIDTLLEDADPAVRAAAVDAFEALAEPPDSVARLTALTGPGDPRVRRAAARGLARIGSSVPGFRDPTGAPIDLATRGRARGHLLTLLEDPDARIRVQVATGLAVPATRAERDAARKLASDPDRRVRIAVVRSLAVPNAHLDILETLLLRDRDLHVQWAVLESLARVGAPATERLVDRVINEQNAWLRERAVRSLNEADPSIASRAANSLSLDESAGVRAATAVALIGVDTPESRVVVERLSGDPDPRVRAAIVPAIAAGLGPIADRLAAAVADPAPAVRAAAARAAGQRLAVKIADETMTTDAVTLLERVWERSAGGGAEVLVRREVLDQCVRGGVVPGVRAFLSRALDDPEWSVRALAREHLAGLPGGPAADGAAGPAVDLPLERYVELLRWAATPRAAVVTVERPGFTPGRFTIRLETATAPLTAWRFARLAEQGFYDGVEVHRVTPNFILQDGDPQGDGFGAPGTWAREELGATTFPAGTMAMLQHGRDLVGSQWFVTLTDQPGLIGRYTAFARVVQNLPGVVSLVVPGDRIVSVRVYAGDGSEPLPPLQR